MARLVIKDFSVNCGKSTCKEPQSGQRIPVNKMPSASQARNNSSVVSDSSAGTSIRTPARGVDTNQSQASQGSLWISAGIPACNICSRTGSAAARLAKSATRIRFMVLFPLMLGSLVVILAWTRRTLHWVIIGLMAGVIGVLLLLPDRDFLHCRSAPDRKSVV